MKVIRIGTHIGDVEVVEIDGSLDSMQQLVEGYIEPCAPKELSDQGIEVLCNEDGLLKGLPLNVNLFPFFYVGQCVALAWDRDEFCGLDDNQLRFVKGWLRGLLDSV